MTDAQINMFGNQLSRLPEFSNLANGNESYESLAAKIKEMLRDPIQQNSFYPTYKTLALKLECIGEYTYCILQYIFKIHSNTL
jgi:hypothetical protein